MTKKELVAAVAKETEMPKAQVDRVIRSMLDNVSNALSSDDKVSFIGFGTFYVAERAARTGRNPRTGDPIEIPASKVPKFRAGNTLKDAVAK
jgi:DNA-binding protein HU-beta